MQKTLFIINPFSGARKLDIEKIIGDNFDKSKFEYKIKYTKYPGHGAQIAKEAVVSGNDLVIAVGGDGTVNEVASQLINTDVVMGILPAGSGNGFAMHLGLGRDIEKAIKMLNKSKTVIVDTGKVNGNTFVNLAGIGFDGLVAYKSKKSNKRGFFNYFVHSVKEAFLYDFESCEMIIDGKRIEREFLVLEVANASMFGYNFKIAPQASLMDGVFDIILIKKARKWRYIFAMWRFFNRSFLKSKLVEYFKAEEIEIFIHKKTYFHLDGEGFEVDGNLKIEMLPLSLKVLVPE